MEQPRIVTREAWLEERKAHLRNEKALTRLRDLVAAERRTLPWVQVTKPYVFETRKGRRTLAELFDGRSQLIVQHFMFGPDWEAGCPNCSLMADHAEGALPHLENHDVAYVRVARAPLAKLEAYGKHLGWGAPWASSHGNDFNFDFHVSFTPEELERGSIYYNYEMLEEPRHLHSELPGHSVFYRNEADEVFHTYSHYGRGVEETIGAFFFLDMTPKGRNEASPMDWVRRHDEYDQVPATRSSAA